jgi:hypothetical protein
MVPSDAEYSIIMQTCSFFVARLPDKPPSGLGKRLENEVDLKTVNQRLIVVRNELCS